MPGVYLEVLGDGGNRGEVLKLPGESFLLGRSKRCRVRLAGDVVSREHASIRLKGSTWYLADRNSRNGTFLNRHRVEEAALRPLDLIMLGEAGPRVRVISLEPAPPVSPDGEDRTRYLRVKPRSGRRRKRERSEEPVAEAILVEPVERGASPPRARSPKARETPPREPERRPAPPPPARAAGPARRPPVLVLAAAAFALLTWFEVWGYGWFPYAEVFAPCMWLWRGVVEVAPGVARNLDPDAMLWITRALFLSYCVLVGFLLQRPIRRGKWILLLGAGHFLAIFAMYGWKL